MERKRKLSHLIKYNTESFYLNIVEDYTFGSDNVIIVKESATGNAAMVINNGRTQEEIPINGTLFGVDYTENKFLYNNGSLEQLNRNIDKLTEIKNKGEVIDFVGPFHKEGSNQYFIKSLKFTTVNDDNSIGFSMVLSENRIANVLVSQKNTKLDKGYITALINLTQELSAPGLSDTNTKQTNYETPLPATITEAEKAKVWSTPLDDFTSQIITDFGCSVAHPFDSVKRFECKNTIHPMSEINEKATKTILNARSRDIIMPVRM